MPAEATNPIRPAVCIPDWNRDTPLEVDSSPRAASVASVTTLICSVAAVVPPPIAIAERSRCFACWSRMSSAVASVASRVVDSR